MISLKFIDDSSNDKNFWQKIIEQHFEIWKKYHLFEISLFK